MTGLNTLLYLYNYVDLSNIYNFNLYYRGLYNCAVICDDWHFSHIWKTLAW